MRRSQQKSYETLEVIKNLSIRKYREEKGLRQEDLAKKIGVDQGAVSKWERGVTRPYAKHVKKMARLFGCTPEDLMREDAPPAQPTQE